MAKKWDPTSQDYPATLGQPPKGQEANIGHQYYGFSDDQIQQMKKAGITVGDLHGMGILAPPEMMTPAPGYSGGTIGGQVMSDFGRQQLQTAATFKASLAAAAANQPQQQAAAPQPQMPQLAPAQPTPTVPITPLAATPQFGATAAAPTMNVPQASAPGATPLFSLGAGQQNWMLPQAQAQPPGGPDQLGQLGGVQRFQGGGPVNQPTPQPWEGGIQSQGYNLGPSSPGDTGGGAYGWYNPMYSGSALGAWALGMPMIVNPTPSGQPSSKSGVSAVGQPQVYPQPAPIGYQGPPINVDGTTLSAAQINTLSVPQFQALQQRGLIPQNALMPSNLAQGPWMQVPSVFNKAPMPTIGTTPAAGWTGNPRMPLTAQVPANAAQMPQMPITPAASAAGAVPQMTLAGGAGQPPAAPGGAPPQMQAGTPTSFMAAHTSALADAGRALFAHFGGDPNLAGPGDIANFHTQLTGMLAQLPQGRTTAAAGANVALATGPPSGGPKKMASGGYVGDPDPDPQVPRQMQQPGSQASQQGSQQAPQSTSANQTLDTAAATGLGGGSNQTQQLANLMAARTMRQNAALSARLPAYPTATTPAAQGYAAAANAGQIVGGAPTTAELGKAAAMTPGQIQGSIAQANMPAAGVASAIGSLGQGLAQAAQAYAASIKPWQMQASAIPNPDDFRRNQQQITLQEPRVV